MQETLRSSVDSATAGRFFAQSELFIEIVVDYWAGSLLPSVS